MTWLHMQFVLIFVTSPSQAEQLPSACCHLLAGCGSPRDGDSYHLFAWPIYLFSNWEGKQECGEGVLLIPLHHYHAHWSKGTLNVYICGQEGVTIVGLVFMISNLKKTAWMKLEESWCYKNAAFSSEDFTLKSKQNKKDQTFVGMHIFWILFFAAGSWLKFKKRI